MRFFLIFFLSLTFGFSQTHSPTSKIENVTVYLKGAQIERVSEVNLTKGKHVLTFKGLTADVVANSIQVKSNMDLTLMSVRKETSFIQNPHIPQRIQQLKDSLQTLKVQKKNEENGKFALTTELDFYLINQNIKGNTTLSVEDFEELTALYRKRIPLIKAEILIKDLLIENLEQQIARYENEILETSGLEQQPETIIYIEVVAKSNTSGIIAFSYYTPNASWIPKYDLRATDVNSPISLIYKADVKQETGNDWQEVNLVLSTADPSIGGVSPTLETWNLRVYKKRKRRRRRAKRKKFRRYNLRGQTERFRSNSLPRMDSDNAFTINNQTHVHFNIEHTYDVNSSKKATIVNINKHSIPSSFYYYAAPKLSTNAYLKSNLSDWGQYNLLPGEAALFFEGSYVGNSMIDPFITKDSLSLSMGVDKDIIIERIQNETKSLEAKNGIKKKMVQSWDIHVKNLKNTSIHLILEDQIPVSTKKNVSIELLNASNAKYDKKTGKLKWEIEIAPGESFNTSFTFEVRYPRNTNISLN